MSDQTNKDSFAHKNEISSTNKANQNEMTPNEDKSKPFFTQQPPPTTFNSFSPYCQISNPQISHFQGNYSSPVMNTPNIYQNQVNALKLTPEQMNLYNMYNQYYQIYQQNQIRLSQQQQHQQQQEKFNNAQKLNQSGNTNSPKQSALAKNFNQFASFQSNKNNLSSKIAPKTASVAVKAQISNPIKNSQESTNKLIAKSLFGEVEDVPTPPIVISTSIPSNYSKAAAIKEKIEEKLKQKEIKLQMSLNKYNQSPSLINQQKDTTNINNFKNKARNNYKKFRDKKNKPDFNKSEAFGNFPFKNEKVGKITGRYFSSHSNSDAKRSTSNTNSFEDVSINDSPNDKRLERIMRFEKSNASSNKSNGRYFSSNFNNSNVKSNLDDEKPFKGYCTDIEKSYFRLTGDALPHPSTVRPQEILLKSVQNIVDRWKKDQDYDYVCDQLKAVRQDLVVQKIENRFTLKVYEMHARLAIECGDLTEFNQCQHQLLLLYDKFGTDDERQETKLEFMSYFLIYSIIAHGHQDISQILKKISCEYRKENPTLEYSLAILEAYTSTNYQFIFNTINCAPQMSGYLVDILISKIRVEMLLSLIKSFRPSIEIDLIRKLLGFSTISDTMKFLLKQKFVVLVESDIESNINNELPPAIDCRASFSACKSE